MLTRERVWRDGREWVEASGYLLTEKTASREPEGREGVDLREKRLDGILHVVARFEDSFYM